MMSRRWAATATAASALLGVTGMTASVGATTPSPSTPPATPAPNTTEPAGPGGDTVWRETFDGETAAEWTTTTSGAVGDEYAGWTMVDRDQWFGDARPSDVGCDPEVNAADGALDARCFLDGRNQFTRADGVIAVADNGLLGVRGGSVAPDEHVVSALTSPPIDVAGETRLELAFDVHHREGHKTVMAVSASIDGAEPAELLRLSAARRSANGGGNYFSAQPAAIIDLPEGASTLQLTFSFDGERAGVPGGGYTAIDDVLLRTPLTPLADDATSTDLHVISDIQVEGLPYVHGALELLHEHAPDPAAMLLVGDIISGPREAVQEDQVAEYQLVTDAFNTGPLAPVVVSAIGNHDVRSDVIPLDNQIANFLDFANQWGVETDSTYYEYVAAGADGADVPVLVIGKEIEGENSVDLTDEQLTFLAERLEFWSAQGKQVFVLSHHVLPWTVSGTYGNFYADDFGDGLAKLLAVLGAHPNAIVFTAHSHWNPRHNDWTVREVVPGGDPDGFTVINTGALAMEFAPSPTDPWDEDSLTDRPESPSATVVNVYADRTVITAYDVLTGDPINTVTVPNPLV